MSGRASRWRTMAAPGQVAIRRTSSDALGVEAGSLTYGAFLSLPPLIVVVLSIAGRVLRDDPATTERLLRTVSEAVPGLDQILGTAITARSAQQLGVGIVGLVTIVWAASGFAARARHAFGHVFRTERTGLVIGRASAAVVGTPILLLFVALAAIGNLTAGLRIAGSLPWLAEIVAYGALGLVVFAFALLSYRLLTPGRGPTVREHVTGSALFTVGWLALHLVGAEYAARVVSRSTALYGAIGAIFGVLAFLYLTMWWLLFCAELTQALREVSGPPLQERPTARDSHRSGTPTWEDASMNESAVGTTALQNTPFFAGLSPEDLRGILDVGEPVSYGAGEAIVEEGDTGDGMYIVVAGEARVDVGGRFHVLRAGDFFGEMALISPGRRMATVRAEAEVEALKIPAEEFQSFLMEHPSVAVAMLRAIVSRLREVEQRIDAWMAT